MADDLLGLELIRHAGTGSGGSPMVGKLRCGADGSAVAPLLLVGKYMILRDVWFLG